MFSRLRFWLRKKWIGFLINHLFNFPTVDDILVIKDGKMICKGVALNNEQTAAISQEARYISSTLLYRVLNDNLQYEAMKQICKESQTYDDLYVGKTMIYLIDLQKRILEELANRK